MIEQGSTMTLEAWALCYKNNLDWNHAWATAPANIIPRKLMGIEPTTPGFESIHFNPKPGSLTHAKLKLPTPKGPIEATYQIDSNANAVYELIVPKGMTVTVAPEVKNQTQIQYANRA